MRPINQFNNTVTGRVLVFCPVYPPGHEMRMRIIDANFVRFTDEVTHFIPLEELEPRANADSDPNQNIYVEQGYASRDDYYQYLSEEYDVELDVVYAMADILGEAEDFDGLVTSLEDYSG